MDSTEMAPINGLMRCIVPAFFPSVLALSLAGSAAAVEFSGLTNRGPSGGILVPNSQVVNANNYSIGVHRGVLKAGYGLFNLAELGIALPDIYDGPNRKEWADGSTGFIKMGYSLYPGLTWFPGLAVGAENSLNRSAETYYAAASWHGTFLWWPSDASVGAGTGRFVNRAFAGVGIIPAGFFGRTMKFFCEFAGSQADAGARMALSRNLRLDFAMLMNVNRVDHNGQKHWSMVMDRAIVGASKTDSFNLKNIFRSTKKKKPD